ncbi:AAA family ATPase [Lactococcus cremoris]|uniref:AAA family ATPase n=1 Tax=Lactococcus lactis subsp. cremoris TaxID=1359 RepID=UPI0037BE2BD8
MAYLEKIIIKGFKKFTDYDVQFNNNMNVLIGENEAGKSTIIEAIDLVLNQRFMSLTDSNNEQLFNFANCKNEVSHLERMKKHPEMLDL